MPRSRRSVLAACGALLTTGCTTSTASPPDTTTTDPATTSPNVTEGDIITDVAVQPGVAALSSPDAISVYGDRTEQYVIATIDTVSPSLSPSDITLETDARTYAHDPDVGGMGGRLWQYGQPFGDNATGWLAYTLPKPLATEAATLTWPDGSHLLTTDAITRLTRDPTTFTLDEFSAPDTASMTEDVTLSITVTNTGDTAGTWVGALNRSGPAVAYIPETVIHIDIPPGETKTRTYTNTADSRYAENGGTEMRFMLDSRSDSASQTVQITA